MNNLNQADIPRRGWVCETVFDSAYDDPGAQRLQCEMCGNERVRFVHLMSHPEYTGDLSVGCICAQKMSEDRIGPPERESSLRKRAQRRRRWLTRKWRLSANGNEFLNVDGHNVVIFPNQQYAGKWSFRLDREFCRNTYESSDLAKLAAFDVLWGEIH